MHDTATQDACFLNEAENHIVVYRSSGIGRYYFDKREVETEVIRLSTTPNFN